MQAEYFALEGISELLDTIERIRVELNPELAIEGVVLTMLDERTNLAQQVIAELKKFFGEKLCAATVPRNIRLAEAPSHGKPALVYDPRSKGRRVIYGWRRSCWGGIWRRRIRRRRRALELY